MTRETIHLANGIVITLRPFHPRDVVSILEMHLEEKMAYGTRQVRMQLKPEVGLVSHI